MNQLRTIASRLDRRALVAVFGSLALMAVYVYQGDHEFFDAAVAPGLELGAWAEWASHAWQFAAAALFMGLLPLVWWFTAEGRPLADLGLCLGDWRFGAKATLVLMAVLPPLLWVNAGTPAFQAEYPLAKLAGASWGHFLGWQLCYAVYYFAWEFFFRGFWQLGQRHRVGLMGALVMQASISTLLHIGKPQGETMAAVAAALGFGLLALRTRSFLYVFLLHWYVGALTDLFCILRCSG